MSNAKRNIIEIIVLVGICFLIVAFANSCSASDWNNGICPKCEFRYELRGVSRGIKAYACPECRKEVRRY